MNTILFISLIVTFTLVNSLPCNITCGTSKCNIDCQSFDIPTCHCQGYNQSICTCARSCSLLKGPCNWNSDCCIHSFQVTCFFNLCQDMDNLCAGSGTQCSSNKGCCSGLCKYLSEFDPGTCA